MQFTLTQALQFTGLIPCLFVIVALISAGHRDPKVSVIPVLYFLILAASFVLPIHHVILSPDWQETTALWLLFAEAALPAASFLLIMQFALGKPPSRIYWLIGLLPVIGASPFAYSNEMQVDVCVMDSICTSSGLLYQWYHLMGALFVFLLLILLFSRIGEQMPENEAKREHKYWLIISLILMSLVIMIITLAGLAGRIQPEDGLLAITITKLSFIYLALTSLVHVFTLAPKSEGETAAQAAQTSTKDVDPELIGRIHTAMEKDKLYREMGFSREVLAKHLDVGTHVVSKAINRHYEINFNEFINRYRLDDAKHRLANEDTSVSVIAFDAGFNSIASFNRVFRNAVGSSPSQYRAEHQKKD